jgi:hypothetical protein
MSVIPQRHVPRHTRPETLNSTVVLTPAGRKEGGKIIERISDDDVGQRRWIR